MYAHASALDLKVKRSAKSVPTLFLHVCVDRLSPLGPAGEAVALGVGASTGGGGASPAAGKLLACPGPSPVSAKPVESAALAARGLPASWICSSGSDHPWIRQGNFFKPPFVRVSAG